MLIIVYNMYYNNIKSVIRGKMDEEKIYKILSKR